MTRRPIWEELPRLRTQRNRLALLLAGFLFALAPLLVTVSYRIGRQAGREVGYADGVTVGRVDGVRQLVERVRQGGSFTWQDERFHVYWRDRPEAWDKVARR